MEAPQVITTSVAVLASAVTLGTVLWRLASAIERLTLLVDRLSRDVDGHADRLAAVEATRPTHESVRSALDSLRVEIERDTLRRANEPRQTYGERLSGAPQAIEPEQLMRGRR